MTKRAGSAGSGPLGILSLLLGTAFAADSPPAPCAIADPSNKEDVEITRAPLASLR
jgi:hypothetical protein